MTRSAKAVARCKLRALLKFFSRFLSKFSVSVSFSLTNFAFAKRDNYISPAQMAKFWTLTFFFLTV